MERKGILMKKEFLEIININFSYGNKVILSNINFDVRKGESVSIFGPNGSGKTTLIKIILGIITPKSGRVLYNGMDVLKMKDEERAKIFSYVPQKTNFIFPISTFDYLLLGRAPYINGFAKKEDKEIVLMWMEKFNLMHLKDINVQFLSEGEKQILTLIRTIIQESEIILLDEPLIYLDLKYKSKILNLLKELNINGKTIISVFHDIESIKFLSKRVIFLKNGRIEKIGDVEDLIESQKINSLFEEKIIF